MSPLVSLARVVALAAVAVLVAGAARAQLPGPLVDAAWLEAHRGDVRVVEVHPDAPGDATIPGAAVVGMDQLRASRDVGAERFDRLTLPPAAFEALMAEADVDADDRVVVAWTGMGASGASDAAYLYWQLRHYGHDAVALLDGGVAAVASLAETMAAPARADGPAFAAEPRSGFNITTPELAALVARGRPALVDNRPLAFHVGLAQKSYVARPGHIPGSAIFPFTFMVQAGEAPLFHDRERLARLAEDLGVPSREPLIVYCNSGRVSALGWFVLNELVGRDAVLYDGSLHAWARDEARPMTTAMAR
jgi:thiosulfate/3-mercaptopyruvate sulfurtransferase